MSEVKKWHMPRGTSVSEGEYGEFVLASDYDALAGRYECNTAIMRARTKALDRVTAERDAALAVPPPAGVREQLARLRAQIVQSISRRKTG